MRVKWRCKADWWEWVGLTPPHLQNGLTQVGLYWLLSLAWIYQRAERAHPRGLISKEIKSAGQNTVLATVPMNVKHVSACFHVYEVLEFVLLALAEEAVCVLMCVSLHAMCVEAGDIFGLIPVLLLVGFCCDMWNTLFCMQIVAAAGSLRTAPGQAFPLRKKKGSPLFSPPLCWATLLSQPLLVAPKEVELQVRGNLIILSHLLPWVAVH